MTDEKFMEIAVNEAKKCKPSESYFCVGAVIVKNNNIMSKGYTHKYPNLHAEECAILEAKADLKGSTLYSTIEPCSKRKSKERSCAELILKKKISRVVFGAYEPKIFVDCEGT